MRQTLMLAGKTRVNITRTISLIKFDNISSFQALHFSHADVKIRRLTDPKSIASWLIWTINITALKYSSIQRFYPHNKF